MIGLKRGTVALFPHEEEWEKEAERTVRKRTNDLSDQLLFAAGSYYDGTGDEQTHFIHVVKYGGKAWTDYINFRNYLNGDFSAAREYEALKLRLAAEAPVDSGRERYLAGKHDFIVNTLRKAAVSALLGKTVKIIIDRPLGTEHKGMIYPVNYGYIPGTFGGDGEELDVYLLGVDSAVKEYECRIIGAIYRKNDVEDKLIGAPEGVMFTKEEITDAVRFQEQWFVTETVII